MDIDSSDSYLTLISATDSMTVSVSGSGAAKTGPARFVAGAFWVADGELDGTDYKDWVFGFDHGILLDLTSGVYTISSEDMNNAGLRGYGLVDSVVMKASIDAANDAGGMINTTTNVWYLNYSETISGKTIEVHLEGTSTTSPW